MFPEGFYFREIDNRHIEALETNYLKKKFQMLRNNKKVKKIKLFHECLSKWRAIDNYF